MKDLKKPELLLPAGSPEMLEAAIHFGADAVYIGGEAYSLRKRADHFDPHAMHEAIEFAHRKGAKVYVAANIFARNTDLAGMREYFENLKSLRPDALIISDPGVVLLAGSICPDIDIHISTQANSVNYMDFVFWKELGAKRVVCSRELSLEEISEIRSFVDTHAPGLEIECFVHGAMCISYSGRCMLSAFMTGRSANEGACTHPCRWKYALVEEKRPGEYYPIEEDESGTYILNSRDLCMIEHIRELVTAGVDSLKIEGRMKGTGYAAVTARAYRKAIDDYFLDPEVYEKRLPFYMEEVSKTVRRGFSTGFYFGSPSAESAIYDRSTYIKDYVYLGRVLAAENDTAVIFQKNKFSVGDEVEILKPGCVDIPAEVLSIRDFETAREMTSCPHAGEKLFVTLSRTPEKDDILIMKAMGC